MNKIECMRRWIIRCCYWYYVKSDPLISDRLFDALFADLQRREHAVSDYDPKSPTQMIYGDIDRNVKPEAMECCDK